MNYKSLAIKGSITALLGSLLAALLGYLIRRVLAQNPDQTAVGLFCAVFALINLFNLIRNPGITDAFTVLYQSKKDQDKLITTAASIQLTFSFITSIILLALAIPLGKYYFKNEQAPLLLVVLLIYYFLFSVQSIYTELMRAQKKIASFAIVELIRNLITLILLVLLFTKTKSAIAIGVAYSGAVLLMSGFMIRKFPLVKPDLKLAKQLITFGIPVALAGLGYTILAYTDTLVLTWLRPLQDVALYTNGAMPMAIYLMLPAQAIVAILSPIVAELWHSEKKEMLMQGIQLMNKYFYMLIIPLAFVMLAFPEIVLNLLFGPGYVSASKALQILSIGMIAYSFGYINSNVLISIKKPKLTAIAVAIAAVINLVLNFVLIPKYGITGAAASTMICYFAMSVFTILSLHIHLGQVINLKQWTAITISAILFITTVAVIKRLIHINPWAELIVCFSAGGIIYLAILYLTKTIKKEDIYILALRNV